jgi:DNA-binding protein HU-beta
MYKNDIVRLVSKDTRLSQRIIADALNGTVKIVMQALKDGKTVTIPGFGTFYTSQRAEGTVRDIHTGKTLAVPARRVAAFRVGQLLKTAVRNTTPPGKATRKRRFLI